MMTLDRQRALRSLALAIGLVVSASAGSAMAHGGATNEKQKAGDMSGKMKMDMSHAEKHPFGMASDAATAERLIEVDMTDALRFEPGTIEVKQGEPVKFVVRNKGKLMHEMVLGTKEGLEQHAALMKRFPGMEHDEPYMAHVDPGKTGEMGWTFTEPGEYLYGCLVPGHYEGGMVGRIVVK